MLKQCTDCGSIAEYDPQDNKCDSCYCSLTEYEEFPDMSEEDYLFYENEIKTENSEDSKDDFRLPF